MKKTVYFEKVSFGLGIRLLMNALIVLLLFSVVIALADDGAEANGASPSLNEKTFTPVGSEIAEKWMSAAIHGDAESLAKLNEPLFDVGMNQEPLEGAIRDAMTLRRPLLSAHQQSSLHLLTTFFQYLRYQKAIGVDVTEEQNVDLALSYALVARHFKSATSYVAFSRSLSVDQKMLLINQVLQAYDAEVFDGLSQTFLDPERLEKLKEKAHATVDVQETEVPGVVAGLAQKFVDGFGKRRSSNYVKPKIIQACVTALSRT